jgi:Ca-activated chloride channel family protein
VSFDPLLPLPVIVLAAVVTVAWAASRWSTAGVPRSTTARVVALVALTLFIALDPAVEGGSVAAVRSDADVLFVVDTTGSMAAEDYDGEHPRLDGVRADIMGLVDQFAGAHFALVTFDTSERIVVPWTTDVGAVETAVSLLRQERTIYARGSQLDRPVDAMARLVPRTDDGSRYSVVFYLSDGEQTTEAAPPDFRALRDSVTDGAVLGYGSADGGRMRVYTDRESSVDQFIQDPETDDDAISRIDENALRSIADDLDVSYSHRMAPGGIDDLADGIAEGARRERAGERDGDRRLYWVFAFGIVLVALWQLAASAIEFADARRALGGRRAPGGRWVR